LIIILKAIILSNYIFESNIHGILSKSPSRNSSINTPINPRTNILRPYPKLNPKKTNIMMNFIESGISKITLNLDRTKWIEGINPFCVGKSEIEIAGKIT